MTHHDEGRGEPTPETASGTPSANRSDSLAAAEELAAREAAEEARRSPKVVRPTTKTGRGATAKAPSAGASSEVPATPTAVSALAPSGRTEAIDGGSPDETLRLRQSGADVVSARNVDVSMGGIGRAEAADIAVSKGGIGIARGARVSVEMGGIGAAVAGEVRLTQGAAGMVLAREGRVEQAYVRTLIANHVVAERTTGVLFLVARRVDGNVRAVFDWRGGLAFGAAFGLIAVLFRRRK